MAIGVSLGTVWRVLSRAESDDFRYDGEPYGISAERVGYIVALKVFMQGHDHCACHRSICPEEVYLFTMHPQSSHFPLHYTVQDDLLHKLNDVGYGVLLPGFAVVPPRQISYGWLQG